MKRPALAYQGLPVRDLLARAESSLAMDYSGGIYSRSIGTKDKADQAVVLHSNEKLQSGTSRAIDVVYLYLYIISHPSLITSRR